MLQFHGAPFAAVVLVLALLFIVQIAVPLPNHPANYVALGLSC